MVQGRTKATTVFALGLAAALLPLRARAQGMAPMQQGPALGAFGDVGVATKDGAIYRGVLVERVPGDHVTLRLASGDIRRFAWADVVDVATAPEKEREREKEKEKDAADTPDPKPPLVHLVVDGEPGIRLERRQTASEGWTLSVPPGYAYVELWEVSCVAPCKTVVDMNSIYRVNGRTATASHDFTLPSGHDHLKLHLEPRSAILHGLGFTFIVGGTVLALAGGSSLIAAPAVADSSVASAVRGVGVVGLVVGLVGLAAGIPTFLLTYSKALTEDGRTLGQTAPLVAF
jgi:hypothetical protein